MNKVRVHPWVFFALLHVLSDVGGNEVVKVFVTLQKPPRTGRVSRHVLQERYVVDDG